MTKVQIRFPLARPLDDQLLERIAAAHSIYGFALVRPSPALDELIVDYDASRLTVADVEDALHRSGIPIVQRA